MRLKPKLFVILCIVGVFVLLCGCTSQEATPSTPSTSPVTSSTTAMTATPTTAAVKPLTVQFHSIQDYTSSNQFQQPRTGYEFVIVDFSLTNNGYPDGYNFFASNAKIQDPDNYMYSYHSCSYSVPGAFEMTTIPYGQTRRGKLVFEVPIAPTGTSYKLFIE